MKSGGGPRRLLDLIVKQLKSLINSMQNILDHARSNESCLGSVREQRENRSEEPQN